MSALYVVRDFWRKRIVAILNHEPEGEELGHLCGYYGA